MLRRITRLLLTVSLLAAMALPALAQENWFTLLFNSMSKEFVRVNADGTQETYSLSLPEDVFVGARAMAFSPDGSRVAFCTIEYGENGVNTTTLYVRDLAAGADLITRDLGSAIACRVTGNQNYSQLAVAMIRYYTGDPQADTSQSAWEIQMIDVISGDTIRTLNASSPAASVIDYRYGDSFLPYVFRLDAEGVLFGEVPYGTEFPPDFPTYHWQFDSDTLTPSQQPELLFSDYLESTGEMAWIAADASLPAGVPMGPMPSNNVVNVTDANGETRMVYYSPDWLLSSVVFMNGGERLMLQLFEPFDPNSADQTYDTRWIALDRQGSISELFSGATFIELKSAPGGYLAFYTTSQTLPATYQLEYYADGGIETLYTFESDVYGGWEVAYVTPPTFAENLPPFTAVNP